MNKKLVALLILIIGLSLITYGLLTASVRNEAEIFKKYACGRLTLDLRPTDKYCYNPSSAPEAKKDFGNAFTFSGASVIILGAAYAFSIMQPKRK